MAYAIQDNEPAVLALDAKLAAAFPEVSIDRAMIDEQTAKWDIYDNTEGLTDFVGTRWTELDPELLIRHMSLPLYAGDSLWRATLALSIAELDPGTRFHEKSTMLSMRRWEHERTLIEVDGDRTEVRDRVTFERRVAVLGPLLRVGVRLTRSRYR